MEVKFSEGVLKNLIERYPWVNRESFMYILRIENVRKRDIESEIKKIYNERMMFYPKKYELVIPSLTASELNLDCVIELIPDEDGVIYYQYE